MDTKLIRISDIDVDHYQKGDVRKFHHTEEEVSSMVRSLESDGQLVPALVRLKAASADQEGDRYELISGRLRITGLKRLKKKEIFAAVAVDMDDEDAERALLAENLIRSSYEKGKNKAVFVKAWQRYFYLVDKLKAAHAAPAEAKAESDSGQSAVADEVTDAAGGATPPSDAAGAEPAKRGKGRPGDARVKELAEKAGVTDREARRLVKLADRLTPEQLDALSLVSATKDDMEALSGIDDEAGRARAVSLYCSGKPCDEAVRDARAATATADSVADSPAARLAQSAAMADDEWIDATCGEVRARLANPAAFDASAALYRHTRESRQVFRAACKRSLEAATANGPQMSGGFGKLLLQLFRTAHPKDWMVCGVCNGSGADSRGATPSTCPKCRGDGFSLKFEEARA